MVYPFIKDSGWILVWPFRSFDKDNDKDQDMWWPNPGSSPMTFGGLLFFFRNLVHKLTLLARLVWTLPAILIRRRNRLSRHMTRPPS